MASARMVTSANWVPTAPPSSNQVKNTRASAGELKEYTRAERKS